MHHGGGWAGGHSADSEDAGITGDEYTDYLAERNRWRRRAYEALPGLPTECAVEVWIDERMGIDDRLREEIRSHEFWAMSATSAYEGYREELRQLENELTETTESARKRHYMELTGHAVDLGADELRVLARIAERLTMGRRQYGELDVDDGRDWREEATQEALDMAVYLALRLEVGR